MNFSLFSRQRTPLMGFAIIWIMLFHLNCQGDSLLIRVFSTGYLGVEIFCFVSGIGAFFSLCKNDNVKDYFVRKAKRILPVYYLIEIPWMIVLACIGCVSIRYITGIIFIITPFLGSLATWFVTFIIICYVISPCIYHLVKHSLFYVVIFVIIISYFVSLFYQSIIFSRLPIFIIGMIIGYVIKKEENKESIYKPQIVVHLLIVVFSLLFLSGIFIHGYEIVRQICVIIFAYGLTFIFEKMSIFRVFFSFFGEITLELYLLHEYIVFIYLNNHIENKTFVAICSIFIATWASYLINKLILLTFNHFSKKCKIY